MAKYMTSNLIIPQNQGVGRGVLAQVPWHKHGTYPHVWYVCVVGRDKPHSCLTCLFLWYRLGEYAIQLHVYGTKHS